MKKLLSLFICATMLSSCDYFDNSRWQTHFQTMDVNVTILDDGDGGGDVDIFGGAFGDDFQYTPHSQSTDQPSYHWGDEGTSISSHYTPYSVGSSTPYYRGTDDNGNYSRSGDIGSYYGH